MIECPKCGPTREGSLSYLEDATTIRRPIGMSGGTLWFSGDAQTYDDSAENPRFCHDDCGTEFPIPEGVEIAWV